MSDNMIQFGRFKNTTKTKIKTQRGTILKVTTYDGAHYSYPEMEYKVKSACSICGADMGCLCFNSDNSDDPYNDAVSCLKIYWVCDKDDCLIDFMKNDDPEHYGIICEVHAGNKKAITNAISDQLGSLDCGDYCNI